MIPERAEVMEKAKAKRRRREEKKRLRNGSHKEWTVSSEVVNLAIAQLSAWVKTAARKITGS